MRFCGEKCCRQFPWICQWAAIWPSVSVDTSLRSHLILRHLINLHFAQFSHHFSCFSAWSAVHLTNISRMHSPNCTIVKLRSAIAVFRSVWFPFLFSCGALSQLECGLPCWRRFHLDICQFIASAEPTAPSSYRNRIHKEVFFNWTNFYSC